MSSPWFDVGDVELWREPGDEHVAVNHELGYGGRGQRDGDGDQPQDGGRVLVWQRLWGLGPHFAKNLYNLLDKGVLRFISLFELFCN